MISKGSKGRDPYGKGGKGYGKGGKSTGKDGGKDGGKGKGTGDGGLISVSGAVDVEVEEADDEDAIGEEEGDHGAGAAVSSTDLG